MAKCANVFPKGGKSVAKADQRRDAEGSRPPKKKA
jgi:hypothetical protein